MKKTILLSAAMLIMGISAANAGGISFSFFAPAPIYSEPVYVVEQRPAPVYVNTYPVVYRPAYPVYNYGYYYRDGHRYYRDHWDHGKHGWRDHDRGRHDRY